MENKENVKNLVSNYLEANKINVAEIGGEDVVIITSESLFYAIVKKQLAQGKDVKIGNLLENGIGTLGLANKYNNVMQISEHVKSEEARRDVEMFVASTNPQNLKKYLNAAVDEFVTAVGRGFSHIEGSRSVGTFAVDTVVNGKKIARQVAYTDIDVLDKEEKVVNAIDKLTAETQEEFE